MPSVYIALGSNIDPEDNLKAAATMLKELYPGIRFSSVYITKAREVEAQADFLNAVAVIDTKDSPQEVLLKMESIEKHLKKQPPYRYGPRTIDLDLLLYGHDTVSTEGLVIPHAGMDGRRFVLEPLCELIDPKARHPLLNKTWKELLDETQDQHAIRLPILL